MWPEFVVRPFPCTRSKLHRHFLMHMHVFYFAEICKATIYRWSMATISSRCPSCASCKYPPLTTSMHTYTHTHKSTLMLFRFDKTHRRKTSMIFILQSYMAQPYQSAITQFFHQNTVSLFQLALFRCRFGVFLDFNSNPPPYIYLKLLS